MAMATLRNEYPDVPQTGLAARLAIRRNDHAGPTSGLAPGFVQANLAVLPHAQARILHSTSNPLDRGAIL